MDTDLVIDDLDAAATLAAVEGELVSRRAAEAKDLALAAHWADLHASEPRLGPGGRRVWQGDDRLIQVGGEGTPLVQELCIAELAIARRVHHHSARATVADALDLRHRLPSWWRAVQQLRLEPWIARKAAVLSRPLDQLRVGVVDAALPDDLGEISPARLLEVVRAKVIEADPQRHAAALDAEKRRRYVSLSRSDEFGLRHVIARVRAGDAVWIDAMVERIADLIAPRFPDDTTRDALRSEAFGWLARPAVLSREIPEWLGHAHVTVRPVVDLADQVSFDAYEHPGSLAERIDLRNPADSFPHANQVTRRLDLDHVVEYRPGANGQTGDHNSQPLGRSGHRAKTHAGYRVRQLSPGIYAWRTPHGLCRLVDQLGTTVIPAAIGDALFSNAPPQVELAS